MSETNTPKIQPNSFKSRETKKTPEKEKLKAVVNKSQIVNSKKTLGRKFAETFLETEVGDVKRYLIQDVLIPGVKNLVLDGLAMAFFHEDRSRSRSSGYIYGGRRGSNNGYPYSSQYRSSSSNNRRDNGNRRYNSNDKVDYRSIVLTERSAAEEVVFQLHERIRQYKQASVADLFDLMELSGEYVDNNWGWFDERDIGIRRVSNGYLIDVAEAQYLN